MIKHNNWFSTTDISDNIIITFNSTTSNQEFEEYLNYYKKIYDSQKHIEVVFDCRNIIYISIENICKKIVLMKTMQPTHKIYLDKFYIIVSSRYMQSVINFAFSLVKPVSEYEILDTLPSGFL